MRLIVLGVGLGLWAGGALAEAAPPADFARIEVAATPGLSLLDARQIELASSSPQKIAAALGPDRAKVVKGAVIVAPRSLAAKTPSPTAALRRSSFVIDFAEPGVQRRLEALRARHGPRPSPDQVRAFVADLIEPGGNRGFDVASVVAEVARGDCTEYAVLLAALLRAVGYSARVAVGPLLIQAKDEPIIAAGHAWVEVWRDERWRVLDASPLIGDAEVATLAVPVGWLDDEGPGWGLTMFSILRRLPQRIAVR